MGVTEKERKTVTVDLVKCACTDCVCVFNAKQGFERDGRILVGPLVPTITRAGPDASTLVAFATAEQTKAWRASKAPPLNSTLAEVQRSTAESRLSPSP